MAKQSQKSASMAEPIFHAPCAFNPKGVTRAICQRMTSVVSQNHRGCVAICCASPLRACRVCVLQGPNPELIVDSSTGLCMFHTENGEQSHRVNGFARPIYERPPIRARSVKHATPQLVPHIAESPSPPVVPKVAPPEVPTATRVEPRKENLKEQVPVRRQQKKPRDWGFNKGEVWVLDATTEENVRKNVLQVLEEMKRLRDIENFSRKEIRERLGLTRNTVSRIFRLDSLIPEVKELLRPSSSIVGRIGVVEATCLARMRPDLQLEMANRVIRDELSSDGLVVLLRDPSKRAPRECEKLKRANPRRLSWSFRKKTLNRTGVLERAVDGITELIAEIIELEGELHPRDALLFAKMLVRCKVSIKKLSQTVDDLP